MIYLCQNCGWRINERKYVKDEKDIGKHLLYNHKPFCSERCINEAKKNPRILERQVIPSDWNEQGWGYPDDIKTWKTERKVNRIREKRNK